MVKRVLKRDGRHVEFNNQKIVAAILKAMDVTEAGEDIVLAAQIAHAISTLEKEEMTVEEIQDVVENQLMNSPRQEVAKEYIRYRNKRNLARKAKTNEIFQTIIDAQVNDITRENANMNADTPAGMMMKFASEATKSYVDECLLSDPVREAVAQNYIHIHDKDYYPTKSLTCIQHPLDIILEYGLKAGHGESRPAKRIETASVLACISMETVQNEMHGGQAIPAFDFYLAPFVRKTFEEEVDQVSDLFNTDYSDLKKIDIDDFSMTAINFTVPEGLEEGPVEVTTVYGKKKARFNYHDTRGMLFDDWDNGWPDDYANGQFKHGWHGARISNDEYSLDGYYLLLGDVDFTDGAWDDSNLCFEYWPEATDRLSDRVSFANFANMALKFEVNIPSSNPWTNLSMQCIFTGDAQVTNATANNTFFHDVDYPRGLWTPWNQTGSYDTGGKWVTVTLPLSTFKYLEDGTPAGTPLTAENFTGLTLFIWNGVQNGTTCHPIIRIDNIRAVEL
jgi:transcriptional regulator NrdR family protein